MSYAYIPDKITLQELIQDAVESSIEKSLPVAIRKATRQKWLTTDEVMDILQCSRRHVQHLRDSGRIPFRQNSRTIRYDIDEVESYINRGKVNNNGGEK